MKEYKLVRPSKGGCSACDLLKICNSIHSSPVCFAHSREGYTMFHWEEVKDD